MGRGGVRVTLRSTDLGSGLGFKVLFWAVFEVFLFKKNGVTIGPLFWYCPEIPVEAQDIGYTW